MFNILTSNLSVCRDFSARDAKLLRSALLWRENRAKNGCLKEGGPGEKAPCAILAQPHFFRFFLHPAGGRRGEVRRHPLARSATLKKRAKFSS